MKEFANVARKYFNTKDNITIMEIGSLDGADAKFLNDQFPNSAVYIIEGSTHIFNKYALNKIEGVTAFNKVFFNKVTELDYYTKEYEGNSGILDRVNNGISTPIKSIDRAKTTTLDIFCKENKIAKIDLLKIDVEGTIFEVLQGGINMLKFTHIMHLETESVEYYKGQHLANDVRKFLKHHGFYCLKCSKVASGLNQYDEIWINKLIDHSIG